MNEGIVGTVYQCYTLMELSVENLVRVISIYVGISHIPTTYAIAIIIKGCEWECGVL